MKMYVGVTDDDWFEALRREECDEINFWKPGGNTNFRALDPGGLFLLKLHSPKNYIVGGGFFLKFSILPSSLAWEAFGIANGAKSLFEFNNRIYKYRKTNRFSDSDPQIGCIILSQPFFFHEEDWIPIPVNWSKNIVQGKTYDTSEYHGSQLYQQVSKVLHKQASFEDLFKEEPNVYGKEQIIKPRLGQGAFKVFITDVYKRKCAITGEKTLPVLEAAHIKPYSINGPNDINNGLLLRRDFHTLFDRGYITIDKEFKINVSRRIKEDYGNGREYYAHHGRNLLMLPGSKEERPGLHYLEWHNENVYLG